MVMAALHLTKTFTGDLIRFEGAPGENFLNLVVESSKKPILMQKIDLPRVQAIEKIVSDCESNG